MHNISKEQLIKLQKTYEEFNKLGIPSEYFRKWLVYQAIANSENIKNDVNLNVDFVKSKAAFLNELEREFVKIRQTKGIKNTALVKKDPEMGYLALYANLNNRKFGYDFTESSSEELSQLIIRLININGSGQIICDLGCGEGNFLLSVCDYMKKHNYIPKTIMGMDIDKQNAFIAQALLKINFPDFYIDVKPGNIFKDRLPSPCEYYAGFVFPPFGLKVIEEKESEVVDYLFTRKNSNELLFIDKLLKHLPHGLAAAIVPNSVLYNESDVQYIKKLLEKNQIQGIIELPSGALNFSGVKTSIIVFAKGSHYMRENGVKLVDYSDIKYSGNYKNYKLPYEEIYKTYQQTKPTPIEKILKNNILTPSNLLLSKKVMKTGIKLSDIAEVFTGSKFTVSHFKPLLSQKWTNTRILTSSNIVDGTVDWDNLQYISINHNEYDKYIIHKNDIVVTTKSSKVKVALITREPKEKVIVTGGMIVIRCNKDNYLPSYISMFLQSAKGQIALKYIQKGTFIVSISCNDMKQLQIPKLSLAKQQYIAEEYREKLNDLHFYKQQLDKAEANINDFINSISDEEN